MNDNDIIIKSIENLERTVSIQYLCYYEDLIFVTITKEQCEQIFHPFVLEELMFQLHTYYSNKSMSALTASNLSYFLNRAKEVVEESKIIDQCNSLLQYVKSCKGDKASANAMELMQQKLPCVPNLDQEKADQLIYSYLVYEYVIVGLLGEPHLSLSEESDYIDNYDTLLVIQNVMQDYETVFQDPVYYSNAKKILNLFIQRYIHHIDPKGKCLLNKARELKGAIERSHGGKVQVLKNMN